MFTSLYCAGNFDSLAALIKNTPPLFYSAQHLAHLQSMYLFWWWMVRLVSFPCSSPKLGLAVRLVQSSNPHRTSLRDERGVNEYVKSWHLLQNWGQEATAFHLLLSALNPSLTRGVRTTVSLLRALRIELFIAESISRAWKKVFSLNKTLCGMQYFWLKSTQNVL